MDWRLILMGVIDMEILRCDFDKDYFYGDDNWAEICAALGIIDYNDWYDNGFELPYAIRFGAINIEAFYED